MSIFGFFNKGKKKKQTGVPEQSKRPAKATDEEIAATILQYEHDDTLMRRFIQHGLPVKSSAALFMLAKNARTRTLYSITATRLKAPEVTAEMTDKELITALLLYQNDRELGGILRPELLPLIKSNQALYNLALSADNRELRVEAAQHIRDPGLLTRFALQMPEYGAWTIMERLQAYPDGMQRLQRVGAQAREKKVRSKALQYWAKAENTPQAWLDYARAAEVSHPLSYIDDIALLSKAATEDESAFIRDNVVCIAGEKLKSEVLMTYVLRGDNSAKTRAKTAALLLKRNAADPEGKLHALLPGLAEHYLPLACEMSRRNDARALPVLIERANTSYDNPDGWDAIDAMGNITTAESVRALTELLRKNQRCAALAAPALKRLYQNAADPAVKTAVEAVPQKRYYDHTDAGTRGASCHTDINMVDFYLKE